MNEKKNSMCQTSNGIFKSQNDNAIERMLHLEKDYEQMTYEHVFIYL